MRLRVDIAKHHLFREPCQRADDDGRQDERRPEVQAELERLEAQVGAKRVERTVGKVHEAQETEDDRQAYCQQEVEHPDANAIDDLQQIDVHKPCE